MRKEIETISSAELHPRRKRGSESRMKRSREEERLKDDVQKRLTNNKIKWRRLIAEIRSSAGSRRPVARESGDGVGCGGERRSETCEKGERRRSLRGRSAIWVQKGPGLARGTISFATPPPQRPADSPSLSLLFSLFSSPSSPSPAVSFLEAREARTTWLLEKSARLPGGP